jgi:hypothetical protein
MTATLAAEVLHDDLAVSLARALAKANERARELGVDIPRSVISISQQPVDEGEIWRVNYGPKNPVGRRGGDLIIDVDPSGTSIRQVLWGQ